MAKKYLLKYNLQFFAENEGNGNDDPDQTGEGDGAGTTGEGTGTNTGDDTGTGTSGKGEKTFNQRQVSAMMTKEKKQGRNAAFAELGIDPNNAQQTLPNGDAQCHQKLRAFLRPWLRGAGHFHRRQEKCMASWHQGLRYTVCPTL